MELEIERPKQGGGGGINSDMIWKRTKTRHTLRFFAHQHGGKYHLGVGESVHFIDNQPRSCTGGNCPYCKEARETKDKDLRVRNSYAVAVVDIDGDLDKVLIYRAPSTVYSKLIEQVEESGAEEILGNDGVDMVLKYDANAQPSMMYSLTPRLKGSASLEIDEDDVPDIRDAVEGGAMSADADTKTEPATGEADEDGMVTFKDAKGAICKGTDTGRVRMGKHVIEYNGKLVSVPEDRILSGAETQEEEAPAGCVACGGTGKNSKGKKCPICKGTGEAPSNEELEVGDSVTLESEHNEVIYAITEIEGDAVTVKDEEGDEYEVELSDCTKVQ